MSDEPKLAPCPICGNPAEINYMAAMHSEPGSADTTMALISCKDIGCIRQSRYQGTTFAIGDWNRRVPAPAVPDDVAAVAAVRTLEAFGYTFLGGKLWKPPLGPCPDFDTIAAQAAELAQARSALERISNGDVDWLHKPANEMADLARAALTHPTGEPRINWRDDPDAIVEDDEMDARSGEGTE